MIRPSLRAISAGGFPTLLLCAALAIPSILRAQDIGVDESALFADTSSLTDSAAVTQTAAAATAGEAKSLGISGSLLSLIQASGTRAFFDSPDADSTGLYGAVIGDVVLDARLQRGFKAYLNMEVSYQPSQSSLGPDSATEWRVPEAFLDANIAHRAYFRFGKQVLQWGRGYFFNPTDLVNTDRKSFFRRVGNREGVFGAKVHVPFGTVWNLYGFADAQGAGRIDSVAGAFRVERLFGGTEMSVMIWDRGGGQPVYGADVSTRFLGLDATGELALHPEFTRRTLSASGGLPALRTETETWAPRASAGLGRSFRVSGIKDRLTTVAEYYYNGLGSPDRRMGLTAFLPLIGGTSGAASAATALAAQGLYQANSISRNYAAFFATFSRFIRSDITLTFNAIGNLDQSCALLSGGIAYRDLNDFGLSLNVNAFAGPEDTEYTWTGQAAQIQLIAEAAF